MASDEESSDAVLRETKNECDDFRFITPYDRSWMNEVDCEFYAFHMYYREPIATFVSAVREPALLLRQGYHPVSEPQALDLVAYCNMRGAGRTAEVWLTHFGIVWEDRVISKNLRGNVASHSMDAYGARCSHVMYFRKSIDFNSPMAVRADERDWTVWQGAIIRRSALPSPAMVVHR